VIPYATTDEIMSATWRLEPLCVGGLSLAWSPEFVEYVAGVIATPPTRGRYTDPTAGPLVAAAHREPHLRIALEGLVRALDAQQGWS
jgi:hypothetical protein